MKLAKVLRNFSAKHGPYNPMAFKEHLVPRVKPTPKEIQEAVRWESQLPPPVVRNLRHINPIRQSGPLPTYDGPHTMEDIRKLYYQTTIGRDSCHCYTDPEEIMRRVPGISRKEAEHIAKMPLTPAEQVDYAYLAYNNGLDVFYEPNQVFIARQVVTNSKGEKVELLWNYQTFEDLAMLNVGFAPCKEFTDYHWEIFLWSDPAYKCQGDLDLSVPNTWFEYEMEWQGESVGIADQFNVPEDQREYPSPRNPHCRKELYRSQEDIEEQNRMLNENWAPEEKVNVYNDPNYRFTSSNKTFIQE